MLDSCQRTRRPLPPAIRDAPELLLGLEFAYGAFWQLSTCRPMGWGAGPIPWSVVFDYALAHRLTQDETEDFVYLMRSMDSAYLGHLAAQAPKTEPSAKP